MARFFCKRSRLLRFFGFKRQSSLVGHSSRTIFMAGWLHTIRSVHDTPSKHNRHWVVFTLYNNVRPCLELWPGKVLPSVEPDHTVEKISLEKCRLVAISNDSSNPGDHRFGITFDHKVVVLSAHNPQTMSSWLWILKETLNELRITPTHGGNDYTLVEPMSRAIDAKDDNVYETIFPVPCHSRQSSSPSTKVSFRQSQIAELKQEMARSVNGKGLRFTMRKKELLRGVALVDSPDRGVVIMGWNHQVYPHLVNMLHIGDKIVEVNDHPVTTVKNVHRHLQGNADKVNLIIQRLPLANVICFKRDFDRQDLGIVRDHDKPAMVSDVLGNSLAERQGLHYRCTSYNDLSLDNHVQSWTMTEINNRPLNLFATNDEINQRLNAMGKEISIVFQPFVYIEKCKRELRRIGNYKDYLLF